MMKSVHHLIDFTEVAHRRYWRGSGLYPACGYEAAEHDGKSFVVVSKKSVLPTDTRVTTIDVAVGQ